ncbi:MULTISPECIES: GntR family transcriptional regulator [unclassified Epibacterium]|uniref:GntR family transcriptional regulator n=1 Tax=unclassified Epibacterium TaxID=2639179 RepID=UPI001EF566CD|nr:MULTISPECIES: GntR family transcriptional regulator [unclassified Epibacterium]MCG7624743.1 GntR family transcriptional regulator [Epibacterium sp. Ofav1-8]MCG7628903.1 GntR family transcriptional regulator [Epibacterium sp. MM17-32]
MKLQPIDISKTASAASIVFDALRKAIIEGELEEGTPLRQDEIARLFNTSRIPVREAISRLEEKGLVTSQRFKGAVVAGLHLDELREIFEYRALIEPEVIRRAVPNMDASTLEEAKSFFQGLNTTQDPLAWGDLNRSFHERLYRASGLPYHEDAIAKAMDRVDRYLRAALVRSGNVARSNAEHLAIWQACAAGEADQAAELTRDHIMQSCAGLVRNMTGQD